MNHSVSARTNEPDRRLNERMECNRPAIVRLGNSKLFNCIIKDISRSGARILLPQGAWEPSYFELDYPQYGGIIAVKKIWSADGMLGVKFLNEI